MRLDKLFILGLFSFGVMSCSSNIAIPSNNSGNNIVKQSATNSQIIKVPFDITFSFPNNGLATKAIDKDRLEGLRLTIIQSDSTSKAFDEIDLGNMDTYSKSRTRTWWSIPNVMDSLSGVVDGSDPVGVTSGFYDKSTTPVYELVVTSKLNTANLTKVSGMFNMIAGDNNVITAQGLTFRRNSSGQILKKNGLAVNGNGVLQRDSLGYITGDSPAYDLLQGVQVMGYFDAKANESPTVIANWERTPVAKLISLLRTSSTLSIRNIASSTILTTANRTALQAKIDTETGWLGTDSVQNFPTKHPSLIDVNTLFSDITDVVIPTTAADLFTRIGIIGVSTTLDTSYGGTVTLKDTNGIPLANTTVTLWFGDLASPSISVTSNALGVVGAPIANIIPSNSTVYPSTASYKLQAEVTALPATPTIYKGAKGVSAAVNTASLPANIDIVFANPSVNNAYNANDRLTNNWDGAGFTNADADLVWTAGAAIDDVVKNFIFEGISTSVTAVDPAYIEVGSLTGYAIGQNVVFDSDIVTAATTICKGGTITSIDVANTRLYLNNITTSVPFTTADDTCEPVQTFTFKGTSYSSVWIHSNGALEFASSAPTAIYPYSTSKMNEINTAFAARNIIAPLWTDLEFTAGHAVSYRVDLDNKHITFMWKGKESTPLNTNNVAFQVKLTYDNFGNLPTFSDSNKIDGKGFIEFSYNTGAATMISYENPVLIGVSPNYLRTLQPSGWPTMGIRIPTSQTSFFFFN